MMRDFDSMKIMYIEELWDILGFVIGWIKILEVLRLRCFLSKEGMTQILTLNERRN
jgi:hypothetical protein